MPTHSDDMIGYYSKRAQEYEEVYLRDDPNRNLALSSMANSIKAYLKDRDVLELACGIGYWTKILSLTAKSILATDINDSVIKVAKKNKYGCPVSFKKVDIYQLSFLENKFTGSMSHFLFSHIPKSKIGEHLNNLNKLLKPGSRVFISDDMQLPDDNPISKPNEEDTFSERSLMDGSKYLILKNFYKEEELLTLFKKYLPNITKENIYIDKYFWYISYEIET